MSSFSERSEKAAELALEHELDLLLVTNLVNVRYLCGFGGTNGICIIGPRQRIFVTDFRYVERASTEVPDFELVQGKRDLFPEVVEAVAESGGEQVRVGFDDAHLTVQAHRRLAELFGSSAELVPASGIVEQLRACKDDGELASIRAAAQIGDDAYRWLIEDFGLTGHTELEIARGLERRALDSGADALSFPPIVAAGANGASPHAEPRDVEVPRGALVVIDFGCIVDDYCSDCTRTFASGDVGEEAREVYELVRSAQSAAAAAVIAGVGLGAVDAVAREMITGAGRGDQFGHGLGHGVGLEVHEAPRMGLDAKGALEAGNVVTVEPGVYVPGRFGVRIEDLVVVGSDGAEVLTAVPRELITVQ